METHGYRLFDSAIGRCAIAWSGAGITALQLPEANDRATLRRVARRFPGVPEAPLSDAAGHAVGAVQTLLDGRDTDLSSIVLDMAGIAPFPQRVYEGARAIAAGSTLSYGELAARLGEPGAARAVGQALGRNPFAIIVPCHRVLAAGQRAGGFSAGGGLTTKLRLLTLEQRLDQPRACGFDAAAAVAHLQRVEPAFRPLIEAAGPLPLLRDPGFSPFGALAEAIVYQQLTGKAAATIHARVRALFPQPHLGPTPRQILRCSEARLRGAGLSHNKFLALRDLAAKALDGELPERAEIERLDDETIIERLTGVRGIGRWTVEMLLIFQLGRPDVLPVGDLGIRKGYARLFGHETLPAESELREHGARWAPFRSAASWYLWQAADVPPVGG